MQLDLFSSIPEQEDEKQRIFSLREELEQHNKNYYVNNQPTISDQEFDRLMRELQDLEQKHPELYDPTSPTQHVGSDLQEGAFEQVTHQYPMLSLANTYSEGEIREWYDRVVRGLNGEQPEIVCELKFDGTSISLWYENGILQRAVTRGDGKRGDDVTRNVRTIKSVPQRLNPQLKFPDHFEIRGEILMPWEAFDRLNKEREEQEEPLFANPRNAASGSLKLQKSSEVAKRGLDAYLYYLLGEQLPAQTHFDNLQTAKQWGFQISDAIKVCSTIDQIMEYINFWNTERKKLPVATDGIVLKVNSLKQQQQLGFTAKTPKWAIAYKFQAERALTRLVSVTYQVGRMGTVTPVAELEPVLLAGTIVKRATLHNEDFVRQLDLHIGDMVYVEKGGEIIPKITEVELSARSTDAQEVTFPEVCPECGAKLFRRDGEAAHYCPNSEACPPQVKGRIEHFVERKAMNIDGIGTEIVDMLYKKGWVRTYADLYELHTHRQELIAQDKMGELSVSNMLNAIEQSKQQPFEAVLYALGIPQIGETTAKKIAREIRSIDNLMNASAEQLQAIEDVGPIMAQGIVDWRNKEQNKQIIERLKQYGLNFESTQIVTSDGPLKGLSIVISGTFTQHSRDEYKALIEQNGGKNVSSVSAKTDYILAGENMGPAKLEKAQKLGVKIIDEQTFLQLIKQ